MARYTVGLDLGQSDDYTALAVLEEGGVIVEEAEPTPREAVIYGLMHLERARGMSYVSIVEMVGAMLSAPPLAGHSQLGQLVIDRTGVGAAVFDMFVDAGLSPIGVSIHGGSQVITQAWDDIHVPKADLVAIVKRLLGEQRLRWPDALPFRETLETELSSFRYKLNPVTAHASYAAWREREHDDLVLAVALAAWYAVASPPAAGVSDEREPLQRPRGRIGRLWH